LTADKKGERIMTIKGCYDAMGANYEDVLGRLRKDERIRKFLLKVPADPNYDLLCKSLAEGNMKEAFRAAHTLKGVCQNLSLSKLYQSTGVLTELLRNQTAYTEEMGKALATVKADYEEMCRCISMLEEGE
jgi:chemotaxis protein histidine kinase CheA